MHPSGKDGVSPEHPAWDVVGAFGAVFLHAGLTALLWRFPGQGPATVFLHAGAPLVSAVMVLAVAAAYKLPLGETGLRPPRWKPAFLILGIVLAAAGPAWWWVMKVRPDLLHRMAPDGLLERFGTAGMLFHLLAAAPVGEELVYRGILYPAFRKRLGPAEAALLSAAVFAGMHPLLSGRLYIPWLQFAGGVLLAWTFEKTRSIAPPILLHSLGNGLLAVVCFPP